MIERDRLAPNCPQSLPLAFLHRRVVDADDGTGYLEFTSRPSFPPAPEAMKATIFDIDAERIIARSPAALRARDALLDPSVLAYGNPEASQQVSHVGVSALR
jgi:hypothetical protein